MGSEFGQFIEWNWQQELDWLLLGYLKHTQLQQYMKALNKLYTSYPAMYEVDRSWRIPLGRPYPHRQNRSCPY